MGLRIDIGGGVDDDIPFGLVIPTGHVERRLIVIGLENPPATAAFHILAGRKVVDCRVVRQGIEDGAVRLFERQVGKLHFALGIPAAEDQPGVAVGHVKGQADPAVGDGIIRILFTIDVVDKELAARTHKIVGVDPDLDRDRHGAHVLPLGRKDKVGRRVDVGDGVDRDIPVDFIIARCRRALDR